MNKFNGAIYRYLRVGVILLVSVFMVACGEDSDTSRVVEKIKDTKGNSNTEIDWRYPRNPEDLPEDMRLVTEDYGMPVVKEGKFHFESEVQPWSSWWFPSAKPDMFRGQQAPLHKYDEVVERITGENPGSANYHRENRYNPHAVAWEGLCDAWSIASVYEPEPQDPAMVNGVCMSPYDLKALAILSYEKVDPANWKGWYGQRNDNRFGNIYTDIYPEQLHRLLQVQLRDRHAPFVMDNDPGEQVWSQSVYAADVKIKRREDRQDVVDVEVLLRMAEYKLSPEQIRRDKLEGLGTIARNRVYSYELYGQWKGDEFHVEEGYWTGSSRNDHPDYVIELPDDRKGLGERGSYNPNIDVEMVDQILEKAKTAPTCVPEIEG